MLFIIPDELPSIYCLLVDFLIRSAHAYNRLYKVYRLPLDNLVIENDINLYLNHLSLNQDLQPLSIIVIETTKSNFLSASTNYTQLCDLDNWLRLKLEQIKVFASQIQVHQISMAMISTLKPVASSLKAFFTRKSWGSLSILVCERVIRRHYNLSKMGRLDRIGLEPWHSTLH